MTDGSAPWKILVVDDDPEVHAVTKLVMGREVVLGRPLEFQWAASGIEAKRILGEEDDIALALVDVVMESDDAGLELTRWIREDLQNRILRVVLRTGHPGEAPEMEVITGYDINDYNEKSELTAKKLRTIFYTALRGYRDLRGLEASCLGLRGFNDLLVDLLGCGDLGDFARRLLDGLGKIFPGLSGLITASPDGDSPPAAIAATGAYDGRNAAEVLVDESAPGTSIRVEDAPLGDGGRSSLVLTPKEDALEEVAERFETMTPVIEKVFRTATGRLNIS